MFFSNKHNAEASRSSYAQIWKAHPPSFRELPMPPKSLSHLDTLKSKWRTAIEKNAKHIRLAVFNTDFQQTGYVTYSKLAKIFHENHVFLNEEEF